MTERAMYQFADIRRVHLELTTKCNASCPMCPRTDHGGLPNSNLPEEELRLADVERICPESFVSRLVQVDLCGNYGDPCAAADCLDIVKYLRRCNPKLVIAVHTNGGLRTAAWWSELAAFVTWVRFGIDGLEDTNHLYRHGVDWQRLMRNASAFIDAGGKADWCFIAFRHNEHQIEAAEELSRRMNFRRFIVKRTSRFSGSDNPAFAVVDQTGATTHVLQPPSNPAYRNQAESVVGDLEGRFGTLDHYLEMCSIQCKAREEQSVYISAGALVMPCCWMAAELYAPGGNRRASHVWSLLKHLPDAEGSVRARGQTVETIVDGKFFQQDVPRSWERGALDETRMKVCARVCGSEYQPVGLQIQRS